MHAVPSSPARYSSTSTALTCASLPTPMKQRTPRSRRSASAESCTPRLPDCETMATLPGRGCRAMKPVACRLGRVGDEPHAVRADEGDAGVGRGARELGLGLFAGVAGLGEAGGDGHRGAHAGGAALGDHLRQLARADGEQREVRRRRQVLEAGRDGQAEELAALGVHRVDGALEPAGEDVLERRAAPAGDVAGGADDGDRLRRQHGVEVRLERRRAATARRRRATAPSGRRRRPAPRRG